MSVRFAGSFIRQGQVFGLGTLVNLGTRPPSRTVRISVNLRALTPLDRQLRMTGRIERVEGRKTYVSAQLIEGTTVCADDQALFLALDLRGLLT